MGRSGLQVPRILTEKQYYQAIQALRTGKQVICAVYCEYQKVSLWFMVYQPS